MIMRKIIIFFFFNKKIQSVVIRIDTYIITEIVLKVSHTQKTILSAF